MRQALVICGLLIFKTLVNNLSAEFKIIKKNDYFCKWLNIEF